MKMYSLFAALLLLQAPVLAQGIGGAPPPNLQDSIMTAGLSTVGADGGNWAYVIWKSPAAATLAGKSFAVYLQAAPGGPFTRQGIIFPTTDVPALELLLSRAANLGANNAELDKDLRDLLRSKSWAGNVDADGIATQTSGFDAKPVSQKMSAVIKRALSSPDAMSAVQTIANVHPALRMALARAWAGRLPAGAGPMTLEIREWTGGADGAVFGRVVLTPGVGVALTAPGKVVQVPDLTPQSDLTIRLRWAVPEALRRQQLHTLGFHVYRVDKGYAEANGMPLNATPTQIETFVTNFGALSMDRVTDAPVPIKQLFNDDDVDDFSLFDFAADPYFLADDANRDQPTSEVPNAPRYGGFADGGRWFYFVRAVDLLGKQGPPSPIGEAVAVRTLPPDVPSGLTVTDLPVGDAGQRHLVLKWKRNAIPTAIPGRTTQRYAIYRSSTASDPESLAMLENPLNFKTLTPIAIVNQPATGEHVSYTDTSAVPGLNNTDRSVWYAVTALHDTPLDSFFTSLHQQVQSEPSPPAFGIFRDRSGPPAPTGSININCGKLIAYAAPNTTEARVSTEPNADPVIYTRARCTRVNPGVKAVQFFYFYHLLQPDQLLYASSEAVHFGESDTVTYEVPFGVNTTIFRDSEVVCIAYGVDDCESIWGVNPLPEATASESLFQVANFAAGLHPTSDFRTGGLLSNYGTAVNFQSVDPLGGGLMRGTLPNHIYDGQSIAVESNSGGLGWQYRGTAQVKDAVALFAHVGRSGTPAYRFIVPPAGGDCACLHDARPADSTTIVPITLTLNIPPTTREWRIYRRVDEGDFALVKTGPIDPTGLPPEAILAQDAMMPPNGAVVRYFAQCFDQNGNASPRSYLGKVQIIPEPASPQLSIPETILTHDNKTVVRVKWFCPRPGIERFHLRALPLTKGDPQAIAHSEMTTYSTPEGGPGIVFNYYYKLPGETKSNSLPDLRRFELPVLDQSVDNALHSADLEVTPGVPYVLIISAIGLAESFVISDSARLYTWKQPATPAPEQLVAWPLRPLPPVITVDEVIAHRLAARAGLPSYLPARSTIPSAAATDLYPVGIRIGQVYGYTVGSVMTPLEITHDVADPACVNHPLVMRTAVFGNFSGNGNELVPTPFSKGENPRSYLFADLMPCVLYRQTLIDGEVTGALVQVSPLRAEIAHRTDVSSSGAAGTQYVTTLLDPFIKAMTHEANGVVATHLYLVDTHSVEEGAAYRYYLAKYRADGEIEFVVNCGTVTIPEAP